jgi:hypothetical protein
MGDMGDDFKALEAHHKALRAKYGVACPECVRRLPKAHPKILLPQAYCRMHKYRDPRPELTNEEWSSA